MMILESSLSHHLLHRHLLKRSEKPLFAAKRRSW